MDFVRSYIPTSFRMQLWPIEHFLTIFVITFGWVRCCFAVAPTQKWWQKWYRNVHSTLCSTNQRFIWKRNTTIRIYTLVLFIFLKMQWDEIGNANWDWATFTIWLNSESQKFCLVHTQVIMWSRFVLDRLHTPGWYANTDANKVLDTQN